MKFFQERHGFLSVFLLLLSEKFLRFAKTPMVSGKHSPILAGQRPNYDTMKNFYEREVECELLLHDLGSCYHLWTPENFEIIFSCDEDFKAGISILGLCALMCYDIRIVAFELMSNHIHLTVFADEDRLIAFFLLFKSKLKKFFNKNGRFINWDIFQERHRKLNDLRDIRNVIIYNHRNGFLVNANYTPFSYPWGSNRYYFNPDAKRLAILEASPMPFRLRRRYMCSHIADKLQGVSAFDNCILQTSFCDIETGEKLFPCASNYFYRLSKNIECQKDIAKEIGERIIYSDDEIYSIVCNISRSRYNLPAPGHLPSAAKLEVARIMKFEYNSGSKQISRILKIPLDTLASIGISNH